MKDNIIERIGNIFKFPDRGANKNIPYNPKSEGGEENPIVWDKKSKLCGQIWSGFFEMLPKRGFCGTMVVNSFKGDGFYKVHVDSYLLGKLLVNHVNQYDFVFIEYLGMKGIPFGDGRTFHDYDVRISKVS